jgi:hypothetical protein
MQATAALTWAQLTEVGIHADHIVTYSHLRAHDQAWVQIPRPLVRKLQNWRQSIDPVDSTLDLDRRFMELTTTYTQEVVNTVRQHIADRVRFHRDAIQAIPADLVMAARAVEIECLCLKYMANLVSIVSMFSLQLSVNVVRYR